MKKRIPRIYIEDYLNINQVISLSKSHTHYVKRVLRMEKKDKLEIFNNTNCIFFSEIIEINSKILKIIILKKQIKNLESPLSMHLGQVMSKNEKMNFSIQKSVELGVNTITPLFSEYCNIQENLICFSKKHIHWKNIAISACQQCNRNNIPEIKSPEHMLTWCKKIYDNEIKIVFDPNAILTINEIPKKINFVRFLIGCEGGFSSLEIEEIIKYGFIPIKLGPRILRTETAVIAAITALQIKFGDLS
ncbi:16S rRNA (uracil(1498)-N(3))-methyltransferase [Buchnera aphidicola (Rhopalosiphum padi)]|uniref:Ribosomal RNA small subunit methyltransferase E n=1 Tax=Buchnera aphidicola subsp. Rhopalosiphum padi TaxID=98793 RepID=A0A4D6YEV3_BUCRP|nr:16S rRNA (uracil(1498)-N(3))-methyltransferase [Buchnera aphidicola]QCI25041.1 16S rRNA (uracil(1498)-N(3))-methyltransferase [Buchnera aphidicola (Rhopalosiphum padi)]